MARILMFERDTVLCSGSPYHISDFRHYDYIGPPWPSDVSWCRNKERKDFIPNCCCNSGLSLVNAPKLAELLRRFPPSTDDNPLLFLSNDMWLLEKANMPRR